MFLITTVFLSLFLFVSIVHVMKLHKIEQHFQKLTDQHISVDEMVFDKSEVSDELSDEDLSALLGSESLHIKNKSHDEKIESLINELQNNRPGTVYNVPHEDVDSTYIAVPKVEYAE